MNLSDVNLNSFLKLGYFIERNESYHPIDFSRIDRARYTNLRHAELLEIGKARLNESFDQLFDASRTHVVPISGGLDSRLILGALLERTEASKIHTYTYGVPGAYDYELGGVVAKRAGTRHVAWPLNQLSYHADDELAFAERSGRRCLLFHHPPMWQLERLYGGFVLWSGYVGDAVAGSWTYEDPSPTLEEAKRRHLQRRTYVRSTRLHRLEDEALLPYVSALQLPAGTITHDEAVLFAEAVPKFTEPHVLIRGLEYVKPLINGPWMDFMFSVPMEHRVHQRLMKDIAAAMFPDLFSLPSRNSLGLRPGASKLQRDAVFYGNRVRKLLHQFVPSVVHPYVLYNDFNEAIRSSPDLQQIVKDSLEALWRRGIVSWLDMDALFKRHVRRLRNHGDALIILASLEFVLKSEEAHLARHTSERAAHSGAGPENQIESA